MEKIELKKKEPSIFIINNEKYNCKKKKKKERRHVRFAFGPANCRRRGL